MMPRTYPLWGPGAITGPELEVLAAADMARAVDEFVLGPRDWRPPQRTAPARSRDPWTKPLPPMPRLHIDEPEF